MMIARSPQSRPGTSTSAASDGGGDGPTAADAVAGDKSGENASTVDGQGNDAELGIRAVEDTASPSATSATDDRQENFDVVIDDDGLRTEIVEVRTRGLRATDYYATNLELTGQTNWFGSLNLANMVAHAGGRIFRALMNQRGGGSESQHSLRVLELGCGLGRAGLLAGHVMGLTCGTAAGIANGNTELELELTDGEMEMVQLVRVNAAINGFAVMDGGHDSGGSVDTGDGGADRRDGMTSSAALPSPPPPPPLAQNIKVGCSFLRWGDEARMSSLLQRYRGGFDVILGADLIYGKAQADLHPLLRTVQVLLREAEEPNEHQQQEQEEEELDDDADIGGGYTAGERRQHPQICFDPADGRPTFFLAFTRRDLAVDALTDLAPQYGLEWQRLADFNVDIFDNDDCDYESDFWRDAIFIFRRAPPLASEPVPESQPSVAVAEADVDVEAGTDADIDTAAAASGSVPEC